MWDNERDAAMQLDGTIVRYKGNPVTVITVFYEQGAIKTCIASLATGRETTVNLVDLDVKPVPLGYVNLGATALYTSRVARRRWKAGLDGSNFKGMEDGGRLGNVNPFRHKRAVSACIKNVYPDLDTCKMLLEEDKRLVAFSRTLALGAKNEYEEGLPLHYKGSRCGVLNEGVVELSPAYHYLDKIIERAVLVN